MSSSARGIHEPSVASPSRGTLFHVTAANLWAFLMLSDIVFSRTGRQKMTVALLDAAECRLPMVPTVSFNTEAIVALGRWRELTSHELLSDFHPLGLQQVFDRRFHQFGIGPYRPLEPRG
jgi:hypothetical protein